MVTFQPPSGTDEAIRNISDSDLLWRIAEGRRLMAQARTLQERLEEEVIQRARARGAKAIITERYTAELEANVSYDTSRFTALLELLPEAGIKEAYIPEHRNTVTVPVKWNTQQAIKWAKKVGGTALNIIAEARMEGAPRVKLTEKGAANGSGG